MNKKIKRNKTFFAIFFAALVAVFFSVSSLCAVPVVLAAEGDEDLPQIPAYDVYGDKYIGSDYLKECGLFGRYFRNPVINMTAEELHENGQLKNQYLNAIAFGGEYQIPGHDPLYTPYYIAPEINGNGKNLLIIYDITKFLPYENGLTEGEKITYCFFGQNATTITSKNLYNFAGKIAPGEDNFDDWYITALNVYIGTTDNTNYTDLYPAAENFRAKDDIFNTFILKNINIINGRVSFGESAPDITILFGEIAFADENVISDNQNQSLFIAGGVYLWNESLTDSTGALSNIDTIDLTDYNFFSNGKNFQAFWIDTNLKYIDFFENDNTVYSGGTWSNGSYRLISYSGYKTVDLSDIYTNGNTSGVFLRSNMQFLTRADYVWGRFDVVSYQGETNFFEDLWGGVSGFFVGVWDGIKKALQWQWDIGVGAFDFAGSAIKWQTNLGKNIIDSVVNFFTGFLNLGSNIFDNPVPWIALVGVVAAVILAVVIITKIFK